MTAAAADARWLPAVALSKEGEQGEARVAVDAAGDATAAWSQFNGSEFEVVVANRPAGGAWQAPQQIGVGFITQIAENAHGAAAAVWVEVTPEKHRIVEVATRPTVSAAWSAPTTLDDAGQQGGNTAPQVAVDSLGNAVAVWTAPPGVDYVDVYASTHPAGGAWSAPAAITHDTYTNEPLLTVDGHGNFTTIWLSGGDIETAVKPAGAANWEAPSVISQHFLTQRLAFAGNERGELVAAWGIGLKDREWLMQVDVKPPGRPWGTPTNVSAITKEVGPPAVAIDANGDAAAVWSASEGQMRHSVVEAAIKAPGAPWQAPTALSRTGAPYNIYPQVVLDSRGDAVAVWWGALRKRRLGVIESSTRPAASPFWQTPSAISGKVPYPARPEIALDEAGNAVAVWRVDHAFAGSSIYAASYTP